MAPPETTPTADGRWTAPPRSATPSTTANPTDGHINRAPKLLIPIQET